MFTSTERENYPAPEIAFTESGDFGDRFAAGVPTVTQEGRRTTSATFDQIRSGDWHVNVLDAQALPGNGAVWSRQVLAIDADGNGITDIAATTWSTIPFRENGVDGNDGEDGLPGPQGERGTDGSKRESWS